MISLFYFIFKMKEYTLNINNITHKFIFNNNSVLISNIILPINKNDKRINIDCCSLSKLNGLVDADGLLLNDSSGNLLSDNTI